MNIRSFKQFLTEMPLPADWDKEVFKTSYKKQIDYALSKAAKIGTGSSRVAFIIPYEGRDTVLKIAKNVKGLAQNEKEADYGLHHMHGGVLIPLIDHDQDNDPPKWIHFEKAEKLTAVKFKQIEGYSFEAFGKMLRAWEDDMKGNNRRAARMDWKYGIPEEEQEKITESELFDEVTQMCSNFSFLVGDFQRLANWGIFKGNPVIIDYGYDEHIEKTYYS